MEFLQKGGIPPGGAARGVAVTLPGGPHAMAWDATNWLVSLRETDSLTGGRGDPDSQSPERLLALPELWAST